MRKTSFLLLAIFAYIPFVSAQRWHVKPTPEEIVYRQQHPKPLPASTQKTTAGTFVMPTDARFPGEFEESQAVALAWIYDIGGIDISSEYADLWAAMANAIQQECQVWIRVENGADTTAVKNFMSSNGTPLTNYRFFVTVSDDFWIRDFGPLGFYYGSNDDVGFLNMNYYPGRDYDNLFPGYLANELGYLEVKTNLYAEGGNYITDGFHRSFHSDVIQSVNTSGPPYTPAHAAWTTQQVNDSIKYVWASTDVITTPTLKCDGGTGHNDMFMKLMDENTFAVMEYPSIVTAADKGIIDGVINTLSTKTSVYGQPYRIFKVPMPTRDDGNITTLCNLLDNDARTFVNGLTVNGSYLMPTYSDAASGNKAGDQVAINLFKQIAPGYKIIPLDARILTIYGGAVHCVTMQIPAENPITIWHPPVLDKQPQVNKFHIVAKATNKSGIASTKCMWRIRGNQNWNTLTLTDSSGYSIGDITDNFTQMSKQTVIEYYITSTSNNGKTITKPITASNGGYYKFYFEVPDGIAELDEARNFALNPFPNPTIGNFVIPVIFDGTRNVQAIITDVMGKRITELDFGSKSNGMSKLEFDISDKAAGMYFIQITADGKLLTTKRVMKQ